MSSLDKESLIKLQQLEPRLSVVQQRFDQFAKTTAETLKAQRIEVSINHAPKSNFIDIEYYWIKLRLHLTVQISHGLLTSTIIAQRDLSQAGLSYVFLGSFEYDESGFCNFKKKDNEDPIELIEYGPVVIAQLLREAIKDGSQQYIIKSK